MKQMGKAERTEFKRTSSTTSRKRRTFPKASLLAIFLMRCSRSVVVKVEASIGRKMYVKGTEAIRQLRIMVAYMARLRLLLILRIEDLWKFLGGIGGKNAYSMSLREIIEFPSTGKRTNISIA